MPGLAVRTDTASPSAAHIGFGSDLAYLERPPTSSSVVFELKNHRMSARPSFEAIEQLLRATIDGWSASLCRQRLSDVNSLVIWKEELSPSSAGHSREDWLRKMFEAWAKIDQAATEEDVLDWDAFLGTPPSRPATTLRAKLKYVGRSNPIAAVDPWAE